MTEEERAAASMLARLRGEIAEDRALLARCLADARTAKSRRAISPEDDAVLALGAVSLHGWYTALESIFERIGRQLDGDVPVGARWHRELITQMTVTIPGVRGAVLPPTLVHDLTELLAFRHFFRHAYGVVLDAPRIDARLVGLLEAAGGVDHALDAFDHFLAAAGVSPPSEG